MTDRSDRATPDATLAATGAGPDDGSGVTRGLVVVVGLAVLAGTVLRFWPRADLWLDEALSVNIARLPVGRIPEALRHDGHPPLYYVLLHLWTAVDASDWWVRALSGLIGLAGMPLAYLAGTRVGRRHGADGLGARRTGLLTLGVYSLLPFLVRYGSETRMYALAAVEVLAGYLLVDDLWSGRTEGRRRVLTTAGLAVVAGLALWTHYWSMWLLAAVGLVALWLSVRGTDPDRRTGARWSVVGLVGGGVLFLPWVPALLYQGAHTGTPWGSVFRPTTMVMVTLVDLAGGAFAEAQALSYVLVGVVAAALTVCVVGGRLVLGGRPQRRVRAELGIVLLTMAVAWVVSYLSGNTYASRYAAVVVPLVVVAVGAGLALARTPRTTVAVAAVVLLMCTVAAAVEIPNDRTEARVMATSILADMARRPTAPAVVVVCPDQLGPATRRALENRSSGPPSVVAFPTGGDGRFVDWVDYSTRNRAARPQVFVDRLVARTDPAATIYLVHAETYRTFEGKCEGVGNALAATRVGESLDSTSRERFFEAMDLTAYRPRS